MAILVVLSEISGGAMASPPNMKDGARHAYATAMKAQIKSDDFAVSDVAGQSGRAIPLKIKSDPAAPADDVFTIGGLPPEVKLSAGKGDDDFWMIRRKDLQSLTMITPDGFTRVFQVAVTRARTADRPPLTLVMNISISSKPSAASAVPSPSPGPSSYVRTAGENALFEKAYEQFKMGDVSGARAIFEYLATKGDAGAAIAMGETYDPVVLGQLFVKGLKPDEAKAVIWYRKADQLGDPKARNRLNALNQK